jgi:hypothetical protein
MMINLQKNFDIVSTWCIQNHVFISEEKTMVMEIISSHAEPTCKRDIFLHLNHDGGFCTNNCISLKKTSTAKYLGVVLDSRWKGEAHVQHLIVKLRQLMPKIYQLRNMLNNINKKILYDAWIESHLRYAIEVYGWANDTNIAKLQKIQNKIVKLLFKQNDFETTNQVYKKMNILKVKQLKEYVIITKNYFDLSNTLAQNRASNKLRNTTVQLYVPTWKNNYGKTIARYYLPKIFNKIPINLQNLKTYGKVKKEIKTWLLSVEL